MAAQRLEVYLTADVEPDCPPYLWTWRGIEEGMPKLLDLFDAESVPGTFFVTGDTAEHYPGCVSDIAARGHEVGCHGFSHQSFATFTEERARSEITRTNEILRAFAPVTSFRAPYLTLPEKFLPLLAADGIRTDSSRGKYKWKQAPGTSAPGVARLAASIPPSVMRLPALVRNPWLAMLRGPVVLFVHPWEFVDLTRAAIPLDCRFRTGDPALRDLRDTIRWFRDAGAAFRRVADYRPPA